MIFSKQLESGYITVNELDRVVADCRVMANKLSLSITWRIKNRTATAFLKFNGHKVWTGNYTADYPHRILCMMYEGVLVELTKREKENHESVVRMRLIEEERAAERKIINMPSWSEQRSKTFGGK